MVQICYKTSRDYTHLKELLDAGVEVRKNIFSNWERQQFSFLDGRSDVTELTIEEMGAVCN